jgi:hypothetical protein
MGGWVIGVGDMDGGWVIGVSNVDGGWLRIPNCYCSTSPGRRHMPTMGKKDYFLLLGC